MWFFEIHSTFNPNVIKVLAPPFEIQREGWGFFLCQISIIAKSGATFKVEHTLSFDQDETCQEVVVNI